MALKNIKIVQVMLTELDARLGCHTGKYRDFMLRIDSLMDDGWDLHSYNEKTDHGEHGHFILHKAILVRSKKEA